MGILLLPESKLWTLRDVILKGYNVQKDVCSNYPVLDVYPILTGLMTVYSFEALRFGLVINNMSVNRKTYTADG